MMATFRRTFTLRLQDEVFDKIGRIATKEHRSMNNYIEYIILEHFLHVQQEEKLPFVDQKSSVDSRFRFR